MNKKIDSIVFIFIALAVVIFGGYYLSLAAIYSEPNAEDFALSIAPREILTIPSVINLLIFFDSRYTTNLLHGINVLVINRHDLFFIMPISCVIFLWMTVYYFLSSIYNNSNKKHLIALYAGLFVIGYYAVAPSLPYALYYMASTYTYIYPWMFWFIWTGSLLRSFSTDGYRHIILTVIGLIALFFSFGCSELFIVINAITLLAFLFVVITDRNKCFDILPYIIVSVGSLMFIFNCPSNKFTSDRIYGGLDDRFPDTNFIFSSIKMYGKVLFSSIVHPFIILLIVILTWVVRQIKLREAFKSFKANPFFIFLFIQMGSYVANWAYFIPRGSEIENPVYIFNVTLLFSMIGLLVFLPLYLSSFSIELRRLNNYRLILLISLFLILPSIILFPNNYLLIRKEYKLGILQNVKAKYQNFYYNVELVKRNNIYPSIVYFHNPIIIPKSNSLGTDLLPNRKAKDWNVSYEEYFNVDEVRLIGDSIFK